MFKNNSNIRYLMEVMIIKPPRKLWPYMNEDDNFLLPQALPCLAAVIRDANIDVEVIDCSPLKIGWRTLKNIIAKKRPGFILISEPETMWASEGVKLARYAKEIDPNIITIAGGVHFSNYAKETLKNTKIDYIVIGEGEITTVELIKELKKKNPNPKKINGISYKSGKKIIITPPRELICDLDSLPIPAYDLMPMEKYGTSKYLFHPGGATIHHSRGCPYGCKFCVCWQQMSKRKKEKKIPHWRTKSVGRVIEEIEILYHKYNKRGIVFTDDTWNFDPKWSREFAETVIQKKLKIQWFAFMRADLLVRDHKLGVMKKLVEAGLSHIIIGVERKDDKDLKSLNKNVKGDIAKKAFEIMRKNYPSVFAQGTFIIGTEDETVESIKELSRYINEDLMLDYPSFSPLTPVPGTPFWDEAQKKDLIEVKNFESFDWYTPVMRTKHMSREDLEEALFWLNQQHFKVFKVLKNLMTRHTYKRKMYWWFMIVSFRLIIDSIKQKLGLPSKYRRKKNILVNVYIPEWYYK